MHHWSKYPTPDTKLLRIRGGGILTRLFVATLTAAVSGVYNAGWLSTGLGSRVFNRDTNVILNLTSWGNRTPVPDWFCQMPSVFCQSVTILVLYATRTDRSSTRHKLIHSGNFIGTNQIYRGTRHKQTIHDNVFINNL